LNGKANRVRKKHNSMTIAADVKRFCHQIDTDGVFGTYSRRERPSVQFATKDGPIGYAT